MKVIPEPGLEASCARLDGLHRKHPGYVLKVPGGTSLRMLDLGVLEVVAPHREHDQRHPRLGDRGRVCFWLFALLALAGAFTRPARRRRVGLGDPALSTWASSPGVRDAALPDRDRPVHRHARGAGATTITSRRRGPCTPSTRSSSMSEVADGPDTSVIGRPSASGVARARDRVGHRGARSCPPRRRTGGRSGTSVSARRPERAPPSSTIVPVSAIASAQPVSTPSSASSSRGESGGRRRPPRRRRSRQAPPGGTAIRRAARRAQPRPPRRRASPAATRATVAGTRRPARRSARRVAVAERAGAAVARAGPPARGRRRAPSADRARAPRTSSRAAVTAVRHQSRNVSRGTSGSSRIARPARQPARLRQRPAAEPRQPLRALVARLRRERPADDRPSPAPRAPACDFCSRTTRPRRWTSTRRDVDLDRADLVAGAAQRRRPRQRRRVLEPAQLRRQDRADRPGIDRLVGVPAGARVDRAHVQARRAADAVQRLAADLVGQHVACARCRAARGGTPAARRRRARPSTATCTGSSAPPVEERGSSCRNTSRSRHSGSTFSIPITVTSTLGQRRAHAPVALGLDDAPPSRSRRRRSSRPRPPSAPRGTSRAGAGARPRRSRVASPAEVLAPAIVRSNSALISARLRWIAGTRMCDDVSCASWMISSARSVSIALMPCAASASLSPISSVAIDLTLITSRAPCAAGDDGHDRVRLGARRAPSAPTPPARVTAASRRSSCSGSVAIARALIAAPASRSASQSGSSPTALRALGADRRRRLAEVAAQLGVLQRLARRGREALHSCAARISARCIVRTPGALAPQRAADVHQARVVGRRADLRAGVEHVAQLVGEHRHRGVGVLDRERPAEAAALVARPRSSTRSMPAHVRAAAAAAGRRPAAAAASGRSGAASPGAGTRRPRRRRRAGRTRNSVSSNTPLADAAVLAHVAPRTRPTATPPSS